MACMQLPRIYPHTYIGVVFMRFAECVLSDVAAGVVVRTMLRHPCRWECTRGAACTFQLGLHGRCLQLC